MTKDELIARASQLESLAEAPSFTWPRHRREIVRHMLAGDVENMLNWSTVTATMFVGEAPFIQGELQDLHGKDKRYLDAIKESDFGNPPRLSYHKQTSGNLVHQMFHIKQLEDTIGKTVDRMRSVVEFGGGYGAMCLLFHRLGFSGEYHIYDLPEFSLLQEFYLSNMGISATYHPVGRGFQVPPDYVDLLVACFSMSEVDQDLRLAFFATCKPRYALIAYQGKYAEYNNHALFKQFAERFDAYEWITLKPKHCQHSNYLIGRLST